MITSLGFIDSGSRTYDLIGRRRVSYWVMNVCLLLSQPLMAFPRYICKHPSLTCIHACLMNNISKHVIIIYHYSSDNFCLHLVLLFRLELYVYFPRYPVQDELEIALQYHLLPQSHYVQML